MKIHFLEHILMKITKPELKKIILQELHDVRGRPSDQQSVVNTAFRTGPFGNLVTVASDTLDRLIDVIRDSEELAKSDLEGLKNNECQKLMDKIGYLESVISAKINDRAQKNSAQYPN